VHTSHAEQTLENIIICRVFSHDEQMAAVKPIAALLSDLEQGPFRVLVVDSIIALFRVEFAGRGRRRERGREGGNYSLVQTVLARAVQRMKQEGRNVYTM
jgi:hypothetical protein